MPLEYDQISFSGGELAPSVYAHTSLSKYRTGLKTLLNYFVHVQGGVSNRAGFEYLARNKNHSNRARLVAFKFGVEQNYILEFTDGLMRVFRDGGLVLEPAKTPTAITQADPGVVTISAHGFSNGQWVWAESIGGMTELDNSFFVVANATANTFELQDLDGNDVDTSAYTAFTSGGSFSRIFELAHTYTEDELRLIKYTQSADVMTLAHTEHATADLSRTAHYAWSLADIVFLPEIDAPTGISGTASTSGSESFRYKVTAVASETKEESLVGLEATKAITAITQANPAVVTSTAHGYSNGREMYIDDVVGMTELNGRRFTIRNVTANTFELEDEDSSAHTAYTSGGTVALAETELTSAALSSSNTITITWTGVSNADSYNIYKEDNGLFGFIGSTEELTFTDDNINPDLDDTPPKGRDPFAGGVNPGAVTYHKQRRVWGGPDIKPQTVYGTQISNYKNMNVSSPTRDDDAYTFTLDSEEVQQVRHLTSLKKLIAFTSGSSWLIKGGDNAEQITPTSVDADEEFVSACSHVRPLRIGRDILYVEDGGKDILYLNYSFEADGLDGEPLTLLANHLFEEREVVEWAYAAKPYGIIWCVCDDGSMVALTFNRKQQVWAFHRHETDGHFESVATIREGNEDAVYVSVRREINGNTVRYTERMHTRKFSNIEDAFFVDSGLSLNTMNTDTASKVKVSGGTDWETDETLTMTENGGASPFVAGDVGKTIALRIKDSKGKITARCQFEVTAYNSATSLDVTPVTLVPEELRDVYSSHWGRSFTTISGLDHLEGETVSVLADGDVESEKTVSGGQITLTSASNVAHVGLGYNSDLETLEVALEGLKIQNKTKLVGVSEVTIYVKESRGLLAGPDADNLEDYLQREDEDYNEPIEPLTGRAELAVQPTWSEGGQIFIRQADPLPLTILAITPEVEPSD